MSKQQKTHIAGWVSMIVGILTILSFLLAAEHRMTEVETKLGLVVDIQRELRKEILPEIASDVRKLRDLYLGIPNSETCDRSDPRKPEGHMR